MVYLEVEYPPEPVTPTPSKNLAAILEGSEHPATEVPVEENQGDVLMVEADAATNHPAMDNNFDDAFAGSFAFVLKELQQNQANLALRLDKQEDTNAEFRSFM